MVSDTIVHKSTIKSTNFFTFLNFLFLMAQTPVKSIKSTKFKAHKMSFYKAIFKVSHKRSIK